MLDLLIERGINVYRYKKIINTKDNWDGAGASKLKKESHDTFIHFISKRKFNHVENTIFLDRTGYLILGLYGEDNHLSTEITFTPDSIIIFDSDMIDGVPYDKDDEASIIKNLHHWGLD